MALEPIISWWEYTNPEETAIGQLTMWQPGGGTVEADNSANSDLTIKKFIIWNNKGGAEGAQTARNCRITTRDTSGGFGIPMVKEKWVKGRFPSGNVSWFSIGAHLEGADWVEDSMPIQAVGVVETGTIEGAINDGTMGETNAKNYSIFDLKMVIPATASAGPVQGKLRLGYEING